MEETGASCSPDCSLLCLFGLNCFIVHLLKCCCFFFLLFCLFSWSNTGNLWLGIFILSSESVALLSARGQQTVWERSSAAWKSHHSPVFVINVFRSRLRWRFGCYLRHSLAVQPPLWCLITEFCLQADILLETDGSPAGVEDSGSSCMQISSWICTSQRFTSLRGWLHLLSDRFPNNPGRKWVKYA